MTNTKQQTKKPRVYIDGGDCIMIRGPGTAEDTIPFRLSGGNSRNYAIPKADLANLVIRYIWAKALLKMNWLSKGDVLEFLELADQLAPEMTVEMPEAGKVCC